MDEGAVAGSESANDQRDFHLRARRLAGHRHPLFRKPQQTPTLKELIQDFRPKPKRGVGSGLKTRLELQPASGNRPRLVQSACQRQGDGLVEIA